MHLLFFWSRSLVLLNKSRILLYKSRILILHVFCTPTFQARLAPMLILYIYMCSKVGKESSTIDKDFVAIYDGPNEESTKIKELKGDLGNFAITSSGNFLFVKLESDDFGD